MSNAVIEGLAATKNESLEHSAPKAAIKEMVYVGNSVNECLLKIRAAHGPDALIINTRTVRKGALFGRWGGKDFVEVRCGIDLNAGRSVLRDSRTPEQGLTSDRIPMALNQPEAMAVLEKKVADLTRSIDRLVGDSQRRGQSAESTASPVETMDHTQQQPWGRGRRMAKPGSPVIENPFNILLKQLVDSDVALPLAKQMVSELDHSLSAPEAASALRTLISQRVLIAHRMEPLSGKKMEVLAFIGTTGVGKTTTITKLAAQYGLIQHQKIGIITLDTQRIAAAQQLQTYGQLLQIPVKIAHDQLELAEQLAEFEKDGTNLVLLDTAGRSPNDMLPLSETATLFHDMTKVNKYLAIPATLSSRDMDHVIAKFMNTLKPQAIVLTKLDEASDNTCFGKLLTIQAKYGLPLAYITTGQKVPDDIAFPDPHAIAARLLSGAAV